MTVKYPRSGWDHSVHFQFLTTLYLLLTEIFRDLCTAKFIHYIIFLTGGGGQVTKQNVKAPGPLVYIRYLDLIVLLRSFSVHFSQTDP